MHLASLCEITNYRVINQAYLEKFLALLNYKVVEHERLHLFSIISFQIYSHMSESPKFFRKESKRTKAFLLAKTMMVLVLVFLILNTPRLILGFIEVTKLNSVKKCYEHTQNYEVPKQTYILDFIERFLVTLNSSVNFLIYCLTGSEFRSKLVIWMGWRRMERMSSSREGMKLRIGKEISEHSCEGFNSS